MICFFCIPRPFVGEHDKLQRMAIESWRGAVPDSTTILLTTGLPADQESVRNYAIERGKKNGVYEGRDWLKHSENGRPIIDSKIFHLVESFATEDFNASWLCFISADIILGATLPAVLAACAGVERPFIIGQRYDIEPGAPKHTAKLHAACGVDYFIYRPGTIPTEDIPPFIVSGGGGDNWFVWKALTAWNMTVIDATEMLTAIHVNHGHPEWSNGKAGRQGSPEQAHNRQLYLADGMDRICGVNDAPWILTADGQLIERERIA